MDSDAEAGGAGGGGIRNGAYPLAEKVSSFRLLDTAFGTLETQMRLHHEMVMARLAEVRMRQIAVQSRLVLALVLLVGAVPALIALLPEQMGSSRFVWPTGVGVTAFAYLVILIVQLIGQRREVGELKTLVPSTETRRLESKPEFIQMQISSCGTRLSITKSILADPALPESLRVKFEAVKDYWEKRLDRIDDELTRLLSAGSVREEQYAAIKQWIESARRPSDF